MQEQWLLPQGVEEILPEQARQLESTRREILDLFQCWGYELVIPPLIEYLDSLLTGLGHDLDLKTFKLIDQMTGRMMGVRADMTPQVARIDAHHLRRNVPTRLCYLGPVLHTRPDDFGGSRNPMQIGAELYGHAGVESDAEVLCLLIETLKVAQLPAEFIDLGHVGIYRGLTRQAGLSKEQNQTLFEIIQRKAMPELRICLNDWQLESAISEMLLALVELNGDIEVLARARKALAAAPAEVHTAIDELQQLARLVQQHDDSISLHFDLAELRGYHYHTGLMFAAYADGHGAALAQGGRYNDIGKVFGEARPATGFSLDIKSLISLKPLPTAGLNGIMAPAVDDPALRIVINTVRQQGERVVCALPGEECSAQQLGCDRELTCVDGNWTISPAA